MVCVFLTLLLLSSVYTFKGHKCHEDCKILIAKAVKEVVARPNLRKANIWKDYIHRKRREAIPFSHKQASNNVKQFTTAYMTRWSIKLKNWKSFTEIKERKKRYTIWSEERKRLHSERMKAYWKKYKKNLSSPGNMSGMVCNRFKDHANFMKKYWQQQQKCGNKSKICDRMKKVWASKVEKRAEQSAMMKAWWKKINRDGKIYLANGKSKSVKMKAYWKRQKELHPKKFEHDHVESMQNYWKKLKSEGRTERCLKHSQFMKEYWRKCKSLKEIQGKKNRLVQLGDKMKKFWLEHNVEGGPDRREEQRKLMTAFWKKEMEHTPVISSCLKEFWDEMDEETGTDRRQGMSAKLKNYWMNEKEKQNKL
ncbi:hypothetical protein WDU94_002899 [Cyamophila willieti]